MRNVQKLLARGHSKIGMLEVIYYLPGLRLVWSQGRLEKKLSKLDRVSNTNTLENKYGPH